MAYPKVDVQAYRLIPAILVAFSVLALSTHATAGAISINRNLTLDSGDSYTLLTAYAVGNGTLSYSWNTGGLRAMSGCGSYPTCTIDTAGVATGKYAVSVYVNDSSGSSIPPLNTKVTVNSAPSISIIPSTTSAQAGEVVSYKSTISGGTGPFNIILYDSTGNKVSSASIQSPGDSVIMSFNV